MRCVLRTDDFGWTDKVGKNYPIKEPDGCLKLAERFHDALDDLPYVAGVIPRHLKFNGHKWLMSKPVGLTVAVHGWDHGETHADIPNEFHEMSLDEMRERLAKAREKLHYPARHVPKPHHFIPPYNALDATLMEACSHEGLRVIWSGPYGPVGRVGKSVVIPATESLYGASNWVQGAATKSVIDQVDEFLESSAMVVITLHLPWEAARDPEFNGVRQLANKIRPYTMTPDAFAAAFAEEMLS